MASQVKMDVIFYFKVWCEVLSGLAQGDGLIIPYPLRADRGQDPLAVLVLPRTMEPKRPDR